MSIESYLVEGERVLAQSQCFYASNKRLLKFKHHHDSDELDDIPYSNITSISIVRNTRRDLIKPGIIISSVGVCFLLALIALKNSLNSLSGLLSSTVANNTLPGFPFGGFDLSSLFAPIIPLSIVILSLGILLIVSGIFRPQVFIQFRAIGLTRDTEAKFRLGDVKNKVSLNLLNIVRQRSLAMESESINKKMPENGADQIPDHNLLTIDTPLI